MLFHPIKQSVSILLKLCSVKDHRTCQNIITSVIFCSTSWATFFFLLTYDVICDTFFFFSGIYHWTDAQQNRNYFFLNRVVTSVKQPPSLICLLVLPQTDCHNEVQLYFQFLTIQTSCYSLLGKKKLHKFELACLANLCPDTAEEAKALIPRWVFTFQTLASVCMFSILFFIRCLWSCQGEFV